MSSRIFGGEHALFSVHSSFPVIAFPVSDGILVTDVISRRKWSYKLDANMVCLGLNFSPDGTHLICIFKDPNSLLHQRIFRCKDQSIVHDSIIPNSHLFVVVDFLDCILTLISKKIPNPTIHCFAFNPILLNLELISKCVIDEESAEILDVLVLDSSASQIAVTTKSTGLISFYSTTHPGHNTSILTTATGSSLLCGRLRTRSLIQVSLADRSNRTLIILSASGRLSVICPSTCRILAKSDEMGTSVCSIVYENALDTLLVNTGSTGIAYRLSSRDLSVLSRLDLNHSHVNGEEHQGAGSVTHSVLWSPFMCMRGVASLSSLCQGALLVGCLNNGSLFAVSTETEQKLEILNENQIGHTTPKLCSVLYKRPTHIHPISQTCLPPIMPHVKYISPLPPPPLVSLSPDDGRLLLWPSPAVSETLPDDNYITEMSLPRPSPSCLSPSPVPSLPVPLAARRETVHGVLSQPSLLASLSPADYFQPSCIQFAPLESSDSDPSRGICLVVGCKDGSLVSLQWVDVDPPSANHQVVALKHAGWMMSKVRSPAADVYLSHVHEDQAKINPVVGIKLLSTPTLHDPSHLHHSLIVSYASGAVELVEGASLKRTSLLSPPSPLLSNSPPKPIVEVLSAFRILVSRSSQLFVHTLFFIGSSKLASQSVMALPAPLGSLPLAVSRHPLHDSLLVVAFKPSSLTLYLLPTPNASPTKNGSAFVSNFDTNHGLENRISVLGEAKLPFEISETVTDSALTFDPSGSILSVCCRMMSIPSKYLPRRISPTSSITALPIARPITSIIETVRSYDPVDNRDAAAHESSTCMVSERDAETIAMIDSMFPMSILAPSVTSNPLPQDNNAMMVEDKVECSIATVLLDFLTLEVISSLLGSSGVSWSPASWMGYNTSEAHSNLRFGFARMVGGRNRQSGTLSIFKLSRTELAAVSKLFVACCVESDAFSQAIYMNNNQNANSSNISNYNTFRRFGKSLNSSIMGDHALLYDLTLSPATVPHFHPSCLSQSSVSRYLEENINWPQPPESLSRVALTFYDEENHGAVATSSLMVSNRARGMAEFDDGEMTSSTHNVHDQMDILRLQVMPLTSTTSSRIAHLPSNFTHSRPMVPVSFFNSSQQGMDNRREEFTSTSRPLTARRIFTDKEGNATAVTCAAELEVGQTGYYDEGGFDYKLKGAIDENEMRYNGTEGIAELMPVDTFMSRPWSRGGVWKSPGKVVASDVIVGVAGKNIRNEYEVGQMLAARARRAIQESRGIDTFEIAEGTFKEIEQFDRRFGNCESNSSSVIEMHN